MLCLPHFKSSVTSAALGLLPWLLPSLLPLHCLPLRSNMVQSLFVFELSGAPLPPPSFERNGRSASPPQNWTCVSHSVFEYFIEIPHPNLKLKTPSAFTLSLPSPFQTLCRVTSACPGAFTFAFAFAFALALPSFAQELVATFLFVFRRPPPSAFVRNRRMICAPCVFLVTSSGQLWKLF